MIGMRLDPAIARRVDASDIVQDVLLEANLRLVEYLKKPDMPFHLWLRHLAQDRIIDTHRRHRLAQRRSVDREQAIARPAWVRVAFTDRLGRHRDEVWTGDGARILLHEMDHLDGVLCTDWLPPDLLRDGTVVAALKTGDVRHARGAMVVLTPRSARSTNDVRGQLLTAWILAAERGSPAPRSSTR